MKPTPAQASPARQSTRCTVCGRRFEPRFSFQLQEKNGTYVAYCSSRCQLAALGSQEQQTCTVCGQSFVPEFAFQSDVFDRKKVFFCSMGCRQNGARPEPRVRRLAIYNLKGGTGKTTTSVSLAAGVAELGFKVLLVDADPQGSVGVSLGVSAQRGLYQVLVLRADPMGCLESARPNLDVLPSNRTLAAAEVYLTSQPNQHRTMHDRLAQVDGYDLIVVDCSPSVGLLSQNSLRFADGVIIPVSCDYLGVVGLEQAIKTLALLEKNTGHKTRLLGILPTFLDHRLRVCHEAMADLEKRFGSLLLDPIGVSSKLKEAPAAKRTILEHAPRSKGARDYRQLAAWVTGQQLSDGGDVEEDEE